MLSYIPKHWELFRKPLKWKDDWHVNSSNSIKVLMLIIAAKNKFYKVPRRNNDLLHITFNPDFCDY